MTERDDLVDTMADVLENVTWLEAVYSGGTEEEKADYHKLLAGGRHYYTSVIDGTICFGPSRMIGYKANTFVARQRYGEGSGTQTSKRLDKVLATPRMAGDEIELEFKRFCERRGISPHDKAREYWVSPEVKKYLGESNAIQKIFHDGQISETERQQLIAARIGQGRFRANILDYWNSRCPVTGCGVEPALRASHIKPWAACRNNERLDPYNGFLLAAHIDVLFDRGLISFSDDGKIMVSAELPDCESLSLGLNGGNRKIDIHAKHRPYLAYHREHVFRA